MTCIAEILAAAQQDYANHAWDQWEREWSADTAVKAAVKAGHVSSANAAWVRREVLAAWDRTDAAALEAAEAAARAPEAIAQRAAEDARRAAEVATREQAEADARRRGEDHRRRMILGSKLHSLCGPRGNFSSYGGRGVITWTDPATDTDTVVARLRYDYPGDSPDVRKLYAWGVEPSEPITYWVATDEAEECLAAEEAWQARQRESREAAILARREEELRQAGLRAEEAARAARDAEEEHRLRGIVQVRRDWRTLRNYASASRGIRRLHPAAKALLDRIIAAQRRAEELARKRQHREANSPTVTPRRDGFTSTAWEALDGLKL